MAWQLLQVKSQIIIIYIKYKEYAWSIVGLDYMVTWHYVVHFWCSELIPFEMVYLSLRKMHEGLAVESFVVKFKIKKIKIEQVFS